MNANHLKEKQHALVEKRETLLGRFSDAARKRKSTTRVCAEIRRTNEFLECLERIEAENTGTPNTVCPALPGVTPATTFVPYSRISFVRARPSRPVIPCTRTRLVSSIKIAI